MVPVDRGPIPDISSMARLWRNDLSSWIPALWRGPEGCGDAGMPERARDLWREAREGAAELWAAIAPSPTADPAPTEPTETPPTDERILRDFRLLEKLPDGERAAAWQRLLAGLRAEGVPCGGEACGSFEAFRESLAGLGPHFPSRVRSLRSALTLLHHHETLGREPIDRPIALAVMTSWDHNGAYTTAGGFPILDTLVESGSFHVIYVEADEEGDVLTAMEEIYALTGRRTHTLLLGGHGTPNTLAWDEPGRRSAAGGEEETATLDTGDILRGEFSGLGDLLERDGQILLASCSNGSGGEDNPFNLANCLSRSAPGRRVYSMREPGNIHSLKVRDDLSLEIEWTNHAPFVALSSDGELPPLPPRATAAQNAS